MKPFHPAGRTHDAISRESIRTFAAAMPELLYLVSIRNDGADHTLQLYRSFEQIEHSLGWMRHQNACGCRIHGRPWSTRHVLVDDLTPPAIDQLAATYIPTCVIETSPNSFQAWVTVSAGHVPPALATEVAAILATRYGGDAGAAGARQPGAWPSFTNAKLRHRTPDGRYRFTRMIYADGPILTPNAAALLDEAAAALERRARQPQPVAPFAAACGGLHPTSPATEMRVATERIRACLPPGTSPDRSRMDFAIALRLVEKDAEISYIAAVLSHSEKVLGMAPERRNDYIRRTIAAAQAAALHQGPARPSGGAWPVT